MSSRAGLRLFPHFARTARAAPFRKPPGGRLQSTDATAAPTQGTFRRIWNSPVGVKTVHFWYEIIKPRRQYKVNANRMTGHQS